jgi:hypothetical protein
LIIFILKVCAMSTCQTRAFYMCSLLGGLHACLGSLSRMFIHCFDFYSSTAAPTSCGLP